MQPQTLRCKIDTQTYEDIASNKRSFDIRLDNEDIQPDDYYCFIEVVNGEPNREVWRKVAVVERTNDLEESVREDALKRGFAVVGLVPAEYQALEGVFAENGIVVGYAIEKNGENIRVIDGPTYLPPLMTDGVHPQQMNDFMGVGVWPNGQFSIMARCTAGNIEAGQQSVTVIETLISCRTMRIVDDEELDQFVTVDYRFLLVGSLKDLFGNPVTPYLGPLDLDGEEFAEEELDEDEDFEREENDDE